MRSIWTTRQEEMSSSNDSDTAKEERLSKVVSEVGEEAERTTATPAAADEGNNSKKPEAVVAVVEGGEEVKTKEDDAVDDIEKGYVTATKITTDPDGGGTINVNQAQTASDTQNDVTEPCAHISHPGVLFVPGPDFRGGIHTGYHSAHESDDDNNHNEANTTYDVADTLLVEGTLVPDEAETPIYEATLVPEENLVERPEANSKWYKTPLIICGGFTIVGIALAIGLPLGLRAYSTNNDAAAVPPTITLGSDSSPSFRPSSFTSLSPTTTPFFRQKGQPMNGNAPMDLFGGTFSLSTDGSTLAVSAAQLGPMPNRSGYVLIMKWNETLSDYEQLGDPMYGDNYGDGFGYTLALSGDASKLAVGTPYHDMNGEQSGHVKIYLWNEAALNYTQTGDIFYGTQAGDLFGDTLQMSSDGRTLVIGSSSSDTKSTDAGEVRIYRWNETNSSFKLNEVFYGDQDDRFGYSLSISPDDSVIAVGAIGSQDAKYVKTYAWDEDNLIYKQRGLPIYDDPSVKFGWSCSLSSGGMYLAIGALHVSSGGSFDDTTVTTPGQVKVYQWNDTNTKYNQVGDTLLGDGNSDEFGSSVSISRDGKILAVGAPMNDSNNGVQSGQVQLFKLNDSGSNYTLYGEPLIGEASSNYFGGPVAIIGDAKSVAVGAVGNSKQGDFSGQLQIFHIPSP